jgi:hypothetical protein
MPAGILHVAGNAAESSPPLVLIHPYFQAPEGFTPVSRYFSALEQALEYSGPLIIFEEERRIELTKDRIRMRRLKEFSLVPTHPISAVPKELGWDELSLHLGGFPSPVVMGGGYLKKSRHGYEFWGCLGVAYSELKTRMPAVMHRDLVFFEYGEPSQDVAFLLGCCADSSIVPGLRVASLYDRLRHFR